MIHHACYNNDDNIKNFTTFLKNGGTKILPNQDITIATLFENLNIRAARAIGYMVSSNPYGYSPIVWHFLEKIEKMEDVILFLSSILSTTSSLLITGSPEFHENLKNYCISLCKPNVMFSFQESAFVTLKWMISLHSVDPLFINVSELKNPSIAFLALDCFATYAEFCDLSTLPSFEVSEDPTINKGYAEVFIKATKNPKFEFGSIYVPHWLVDAIYEEFIPSYEPKLKRKSLFSLSDEELNMFFNIAHILPGWFFVHILRSRTPNPTTLSIYIRYVSVIPITILDACFDEYIEFLLYAATFSQVESDLKKAVQSSVTALAPHACEIIERVYLRMDFFDSSHLVATLNIITPLIRIIKGEEKLIEEIVSTVIEVISLEKLSVSLCEAVLSFFEAVVSKIQFNEEIYQIAISIFYVFQTENQALPHMPQSAKSMYNSCIEFYSMFSTDIISLPNYEPSMTFTMVPYAIDILTNMKIESQQHVHFLLDTIPFLVKICPIEAVSLGIKLAPLGVKYKMFSQLQAIDNAISSFVYCTREVHFSVLALVFQEQVHQYIPKKSVIVPPSGVCKIGNDLDSMRCIIRSDKGTIPLIVTNTALLPLLLEDWHSVDQIFLNALKNSVSTDNNWVSSRERRLFLKYFEQSQPPHVGIHSWIYRDFFGYEAKIDETFPIPSEHYAPFQVYNEAYKSSEFINDISKRMYTFDYMALLHIVHHNIDVQFQETFHDPICREVAVILNVLPKEQHDESETGNNIYVRRLQTATAENFAHYATNGLVSQQNAVIRLLVRELQSNKEGAVQLLQKNHDVMVKLFDLIDVNDPISFGAMISVISALVSVVPCTFDHLACKLLTRCLTVEKKMTATVDKIISFIPFFINCSGTSKAARKVCNHLQISVEEGLIKAHQPSTNKC